MNAKNASTAALVCGIVGIVGSFIPYVSYVAFVAAIVAIVFGVKGRKLSEENQKGMATAGMVLGIIGVVLGAEHPVCCLRTRHHRLPGRCRRSFLRTGAHDSIKNAIRLRAYSIFYERKEESPF